MLGPQTDGTPGGRLSKLNLPAMAGGAPTPAGAADRAQCAESQPRTVITEHVCCPVAQYDACYHDV